LGKDGQNNDFDWKVAQSSTMSSSLLEGTELPETVTQVTSLSQMSTFATVISQ